MKLMIALAIIVGIVVIWIIATYNRFIRLSNMLKEAWSGVDVQLKRRHDLIPKVIDAIEGFRLYLTVAEEDRLNAMNPPERTPELFERFLPYALALDAEHAWAQHFTDVLQRAQVGGQPYHPIWYASGGWDIAHPAGFADTMGNAFAGAISSSSSAPGSSGGGGGSSGGGGGGGGGGGW